MKRTTELQGFLIIPVKANIAMIMFTSILLLLSVMSVHAGETHVQKKALQASLLKQQNPVSGAVTDEAGNPVVGATVIVKGTLLGTITDSEGNYSFNNVPENGVLVFSFVGMLTQEIEIGDQPRINVTLELDAIVLEEVVAVGYGTQKKVNLTGSVATVNTDRLEGRAITNTASALQGLIPGLNVRPNNNSGGEPGAEMNVNIRGTGSINGGEPFVLIDGVPGNLNTISQNDIESISVLKDAAASAIYGARAPYGVILITTKQGKKNQKVKANYSNNLGWNTPTHLPKLANSYDFATSLNIAASNSGSTPVFNDEQIQNILNYMEDPDNYPGVQPNPSNPNVWGDYGLTNANTDWYDVYFKDWAFQQNHNLSISGGSQTAAFYLGFDIIDQEGALNFANDKYSRYNLTGNLSVDPSDWMTLGVKIRVNSSYNNYPMGEGSKEGIFTNISRAWPTEPVYTPNGDYYMQALSRVPILANGGYDKRYNDRIVVTPNVELRITKDWKINADFTYSTNNYKQNFFQDRITGFAVDGITILDHPSRNFTQISQTMSQSRFFSTNVYSTFSKQFNRHFINILLGGQSELDQYFSLEGWKRDLLTPNIQAIRAATGTFDVTDRINHWSTLGAFARFNYNYQEKYLIEMNARYDGSSRFGEGKRWGLFPSASVGYNVSKENFWEPIQGVVNSFKLRVSYGSLGNQNVSNYLHYVLIPVNSELRYIIDGERPLYAVAPGLGSTGLTWETSNTVNAGLDAAFLSNKLTFTLDVFDRRTEDMVGPGEALPNLLGTAVPKQNNANLKTTGIEFTTVWRQAVNDFSYDLTLIYSDDKTTILDYNNPTKILTTFYEGMVLGEIWGYETLGFFVSEEDVSGSPDQSQLFANWRPGDVKYNDLNDDNVITRGDNTADNPGDRKVIGNSNPRHAFGFIANASYKGFDFSMFWQGVGKRDIMLETNTFFGFASNGIPHISLKEPALDFWTEENTDAYFARPYLTNENDKNQVTQTRYLQSAAYLRLKSLQLGYMLPPQITSKVKMESIRVYFSGENLLTFTNLVEGIDPEATYGTSGRSSGRVYPLSKTMSFGIQVSF